MDGLEVPESIAADRGHRRRDRDCLQIGIGSAIFHETIRNIPDPVMNRDRQNVFIEIPWTIDAPCRRQVSVSVNIERPVFSDIPEGRPRLCLTISLRQPIGISPDDTAGKSGLRSYNMTRIPCRDKDRIRNRAAQIICPFRHFRRNHGLAGPLDRDLASDAVYRRNIGIVR